MADVDPQVQPVQTPQFIGDQSRPITGYSGNKGPETLLKTVGSGIEEGAGIANKAVESSLSDDINQGIDAIRSNYTDRLKTVYQDLTGKQYDVLPTQTNPGTPPQNIQDDIKSQNETMEAARASGKYSSTYIDMQYDDYLKQKRAQYPGYRQFIDEQASKSLGYAMPANKVVAQLTGDINSYAAQITKQKSSVDAGVAQAAASGDPEAIALASRPNIPVTEKSAFLARTQANNANIQALSNTRNDPNADQGMRTAAATQEANARVSAGLSSFIHTFTMGGVTGQQLIDDIQNPKVPQEQRDMEGRQLDQYLGVFKQQQLKAFSQLDPRTGRTLSMDLGGSGEDIINKQMAYASSLSNWMKTGQGGPVASTINYVKAMNNQPMGDMLQSSVNQYVAMHDKVMSDNPNANDYFVNMDRKSASLGPDMQAAVNSRRLPVIAGTDYQGNPKPMAMNNIIQEARTSGMTPSQIGDSNSRNFFNQLVNFHQDLFDKSNPSIQENTARTMFGPGNEGILKNFPVATNQTQGQSTVFNKWFSPAVDQEMFNHIGKKDSNLADQYASLKKNEFSSTVLPGEVNNLNKYAGLKDVIWSYDNEAHRIGVHYFGGGSDSPGDIVSATKDANRLNVSLASMKSMAKHTGEDSNGLIMAALSNGSLGDGPVTQAIRKATQSSYHNSKMDPKEDTKSA